jgi:hypothetical protein
MRNKLLRWAPVLRFVIGFLALMVFLSAMVGFGLPESAASTVLLTGLMIIVWLTLWLGWQRDRQLREAPLPQFLKRKLRDTYPQLSGKDCDLVERGLRQYFLACARSKKRFVAMPSKAVDTMWHEFILHTKAYKDWCQMSLGYFLHHTPAQALGKRDTHNDGLRRAWYWACKDEAINPRAPTRLPLLFALDAKLCITDGFHYLPDCCDIAAKSQAGADGVQTFCAASFSDGSYGGSSSDFGEVELSADGGDGGDGCGGDGGGCGGGGD